MRFRGTFFVLASAATVVVYGACGSARLGPLEGANDSGEARADGDIIGMQDARSDATPARDAAPDAKTSAWPCPPPSDAGTTFDREWVTGPLPPSAPGVANYVLKTASACDRATLLEWERAVSPLTRTWNDANAYCDSLLLEGASDWRLPTRIELLSVVDYGHKEPAIDPTVFPATPSASFWTGTLMFNVFNSPHAYRVHFDFGQAAPYEKIEPFHVRCVRGGR